MRKLKRLALGGCSRVTNQTLFSLSKLKHLRILNLAATQITNNGLLQFAEARKELGFEIASLNLYACRQITKPGLMAVLEILPGLNHVNVRGTMIDGVTVREAKQQFEDVEILSGPIAADSIY